MEGASPLVGILVGSERDLPVVAAAGQVLKKLGVSYEILVRSAHRTPDETLAYARAARQRGLKVLIAGAGLSAHLAGVLAANTTLPVIGVPMAVGSLNGQDALLSTVQMPPGIPVATVAIDGAANAGYLAAQIIAVSDEALAGRIEEDRAARRAHILAVPPVMG
ncbi:MAG: 5-(carboxyamino)imidazole ribonucleotide mutase [Deltaproteobacteria bacterium]|nr:5-(carboxyamino)imidazole ribonucleotide mutase [Deltaproteobacteria bacterium]